VEAAAAQTAVKGRQKVAAVLVDIEHLRVFLSLAALGTQSP
jgi:hypothetical protein